MASPWGGLRTAREVTKLAGLTEIVPTYKAARWPILGKNWAPIDFRTLWLSRVMPLGWTASRLAFQAVELEAAVHNHFARLNARQANPGRTGRVVDYSQNGGEHRNWIGRNRL